MSSIWEEFSQGLSNIDLEHFKTNRTVVEIPLYDYAIKNFTINMMADLIDYDYDLNEPFDGHSQYSYKAMTFPYDNRDRTYQTSGNMIRTWHHYMTLSNYTNIDHYDRIVEFGAGIGQLARNILSKHKIDYHIIDLDCVLKISKRYLRDYDVTFSNQCYDQLASDQKTLLISTWGLSEVDLNTRSNLLSVINPSAIFLTCQRYFDGIDNDRWARSIESKSCQSAVIKNHLWDGGSKYYFIQ